MRHSDQISQLLPYRFKNGVVVTRFAKICPQCKQPVEANCMYGMIVAANDYLLLAARVCCSHCSHSFPLSCIINNQRHVQRVILPHIVYRQLLKMMSAQRVTPDQTVPVSEVPLFHAIRSHSLPVSEVTEAEQQVGRYDGMLIPAWIEYDGQRLDFVRVIPPHLRPMLDEEEKIYRRRMVFRASSSDDDHQLLGA